MSYQNQEQSNVTLPQPLQHASQVHTSPRPVALPVNFDGIPSELKSQPHWVLWDYEKKENGKWTKPPRQLNGQYAKPNDPATWSTFEEVRGAYEKGGFDGIGVMVRDGICGIDLDHVLSTSGDLERWAQEVVDQYAGTYVERSPSGDGVHILAKGKLPRCGKAGPDNRLEFYDERSSRYFTVTGHGVGATGEITDQQAAIDWLSNRYSKTNEAGEKSQLPTDSPATTLLADAAMLASAMQVGDGERFRKLFEYGDFSDYPSQSEADLALANMLARATQDAATLDRLFRASGLFRPRKWDAPHSNDGQTYGQMTIAKALSSENTAKRVEVGASRPCEFVRAADAMAVTDAVDWLIDGVMEQGTSCMLFGASASGKSFVAIDWSCCIATGTDWHGQEVESGAVFYIVGEGQKGFGRRLAAWQQKNGVSLQTAPLYLWQSPIPLSDAASVKKLAADIAKIASDSEPPRMIVIDTLARNIGNSDENSNRDMGLLMNLLDAHLRLPFNATVVIVHHSGNGDRDRLRGASGLTGAVDYEFRVDKKGDARSLVCKKNKEGEEGEDRHFQIERVHLDEGMSSAALVMLDMPKTASGVNLRQPSLTSLSVLKKMTDACGVVPSEELQTALGLSAPPLVVPKEMWKDESIDAGITAGTTDDAKRKAFERAFDQLVNEANLVGTYGGYVWAK
ncbi:MULTISPECIES: phage NrS-1 polymerase family protein [unclassified Cupriavidus]|uniref:phage NrS-1 polymerase family protein n=1 Tax=unclassified Cupriavidus TaxID=2640874 RepID=UPI00313CE995